MDEVKGCSDHNCIFGHPGGMGTNGGCHCLDLHRDPDRRIRAMKNILALRATVANLEQTIDRAYLRLQNADVPRGPWHWEVSDAILRGKS